MKAEERLWAPGAVSWDAVEPAAAALGARRRERLVQHLDESQRHLAGKNSGFFAETMPASEHWRLYPEFRDSVAFVDSEATGLGHPVDYVTTCAPNRGIWCRTARDHLLPVAQCGRKATRQG